MAGVRVLRVGNLALTRWVHLVQTVCSEKSSAALILSTLLPRSCVRYCENKPVPIPTRLSP